jgi:hypothetical protein
MDDILDTKLNLVINKIFMNDGKDYMDIKIKSFIMILYYIPCIITIGLILPSITHSYGPIKSIDEFVKDLYDIVLYGVPESQRTQYDSIFLTLILSHETYLKQEIKDDVADLDLFLLVKETRAKSQGVVFNNLYSKLFPHCEPHDDSVATFYRRKAYLLGLMTKMALDIDLEITGNSDRDHFKFKRLVCASNKNFRK